MMSFCCLMISPRCLEGGGRAALEVEIGALVLPLPSSLLTLRCSARGVDCRGNGAAAAS